MIKAIRNWRRIVGHKDIGGKLVLVRHSLPPGSTKWSCYARRKAVIYLEMKTQEQERDTRPGPLSPPPAPRESVGPRPAQGLHMSWAQHAGMF